MAQAGPLDPVAANPAGSLLVQGSDPATPPPGSDFVDVAAAAGSVVGLRSDGTVVGSGGPTTYGIGTIPTPAPTDVVSITANDVSAAALHRSGSVTTWGYTGSIPNDFGSDNVAVSAGSTYVMVLKADGTVRASGSTFTGEDQIPPGLRDVVAISAGGHRGTSGTRCDFGSALKRDGTVVSWGGTQRSGCSNWDRPGTPPADLPDLASLSAGYDFVAGITPQGQVLAWSSGQYLSGLAPEVSDHVVAVAANAGMALKSDGTAVRLWAPKPCDPDYGCPPEDPVPFPGQKIARIAGDYGVRAGIAVPTAVGNPVLQLRPDSNPAGRAEAFSFVAGQAASTDRLRIYLDGSSKATTVKVGLYTGTPAQPDDLLATGTLSTPAAGRWQQATLSSTVALSAGETYWIAVLGPAKSSRVAFRDREHDGSSKSVTSKESNLTELPSVWRVGSTFDDSPISAYAVPVGAS